MRLSNAANNACWISRIFVAQAWKRGSMIMAVIVTVVMAVMIMGCGRGYTLDRESP